MWVPAVRQMFIRTWKDIHTLAQAGEFPRTRPSQQKAHLVCDDSSDREQIELKRALSSRCRPPHRCCLLCSGLFGRPCLAYWGHTCSFLKRDVLYIVGTAAGSQLGWKKTMPCPFPQTRPRIKPPMPKISTLKLGASAAVEPQKMLEWTALHACVH